MKVVAYSIKSFEKEFLAKANQKKHDITLISNSLSLETAAYAEGKDAVVVFTNDDVSAPVVNRLAEMGIKYIATRSAGTDQIDKDAAASRGIKIANVPVYSPQAIAEHTVALALSLSRQLTRANTHSHNFDFKLDELIGFNFYGKTVGIIGLGHIGLAVAQIFNGLGCHVIGYDVMVPEDLKGIEAVPFNQLLKQADIISLHAPLNTFTAHIINAGSLAAMKNGVMLINTSRGALINTEDVLEALECGKIGYLGLDVYEFEKGLFFEDHQQDKVRDPLLTRLLEYPNVLITPHQGFLTHEALQQIADQTIRNLDNWQQDKCVGKACVCAKNCRAMDAINNPKI
ncbi:2-hydroxyacid dehydrogenase [Mucilaginibacter polytrichastri]|uniref:D-lactate dehydrogenase n=1 Tax=Mucilaginibacter polytrichastri TaxID=1302689 RepID=A0A1Q6A0J5_9SPHI|nr:2-hydroxyacid dehydrogenase [Mucilaginibacter polytrichastri]OKS87518.1 D-lactate dehydrogenase [Mucilaginibacter polytrichastri]SFS91629.1 D-lactate dehydrogenase [Mucilaginibacter polytrichastri]